MKRSKRDCRLYLCGHCSPTTPVCSYFIKIVNQESTRDKRNRLNAQVCHFDLWLILSLKTIDQLMEEKKKKNRNLRNNPLIRVKSLWKQGIYCVLSRGLWKQQNSFSGWHRAARVSYTNASVSQRLWKMHAIRRTKYCSWFWVRFNATRSDRC